MRTIFSQGNYRILEIADNYFDLNHLKGDVYEPRHMVEMHGPEMTTEKLKVLEREFEQLVECEGVFGYVLEQWNPEIGCGWDHVDSCWGFVGQYSESDDRFKHYIVDELKAQIERLK